MGINDAESLTMTLTLTLSLTTLTFKLTLKLQLTLTQLPLSLPVCMAQVGVNDAESIGKWSSILHTDYTHNWEVE